MARSSESILEDIFDELKKTSKSLGEIKDRPSNSKNSSSSSNSSSSDSNSGVISKATDKIFKQIGDLPGALGGVTKSFLDLSDFSKQPLDRLQGVLDSSVRVFNDIPILGGIIGSTLGGIGNLLMSVLNKLNGDLLAYNKFNTEGFYNNDGMEGFQRDLAKTKMPLNDFMSAIVKNKETMASLGADSTSMMGDYITSLKNYENATGALNQALPQQADYILSNIKALKVQGAFDKMNAKERNDSMHEYTRNLNDFSKVLGISTDDLNKKLNGSEGVAKQLDLTLSLMSAGMSRDKAEAASNNVSLAFASMSDLGTDMQSSIDEILSKGTIGNTSDFDKLLNSGSSGTLRQQLEKVAVDMRSGLAAGKDYSKALADSMFKNKDAIIKELESVQVIMKNARPEVAAKANRYIQILTQMTEVPDLKGNTSPFDNFINTVNNTINDVGTGIKKFIGDAFVGSESMFKTISEIAKGNVSVVEGWKDIKPDLGKVLNKLFGEKMGTWLMGGDYNLEGAVNAAGFNYKDLVKTIGDTFNHAVDLATPYLEKAMQATIDYLGKVLEKVIDEVIPDFMKSGPHAGPVEKQQAQQAQAQAHVGGNYGATGSSDAAAIEAVRQAMLKAKEHETPKPAENLPSPATPAPTPVQTASTDKQKEDDQQAPIIPNINAPVSTDNTASTHTNYNQVQTNTQQLLLLQKQVELLRIIADKLANHYQYVRVN